MGENLSGNQPVTRMGLPHPELQRLLERAGKRKPIQEVLQEVDQIQGSLEQIAIAPAEIISKAFTIQPNGPYPRSSSVPPRRGSTATIPFPNPGASSLSPQPYLAASTATSQGMPMAIATAMSSGGASKVPSGSTEAFPVTKSAVNNNQLLAIAPSAAVMRRRLSAAHPDLVGNFSKIVSLVSSTFDMNQIIPQHSAIILEPSPSQDTTGGPPKAHLHSIWADESQGGMLRGSTHELQKSHSRMLGMGDQQPSPSVATKPPVYPSVIRTASVMGDKQLAINHSLDLLNTANPTQSAAILGIPISFQRGELSVANLEKHTRQMERFQEEVEARIHEASEEQRRMHEVAVGGGTVGSSKAGATGSADLLSRSLDLISSSNPKQESSNRDAQASVVGGAGTTTPNLWKQVDVDDEPSAAPKNAPVRGSLENVGGARGGGIGFGFGFGKKLGTDNKKTLSVPLLGSPGGAGGAAKGGDGVIQRSNSFQNPNGEGLNNKLPAKADRNPDEEDGSLSASQLLSKGEAYKKMDRLNTRIATWLRGIDSAPSTTMLTGSTTFAPTNPAADITHSTSKLLGTSNVQLDKDETHHIVITTDQWSMSSGEAQAGDEATDEKAVDAAVGEQQATPVIDVTASFTETRPSLSVNPPEPPPGIRAVQEVLASSTATGKPVSRRLSKITAQHTASVQQQQVSLTVTDPTSAQGMKKAASFTVPMVPIKTRTATERNVKGMGYAAGVTSNTLSVPSSASAPPPRMTTEDAAASGGAGFTELNILVTVADEDAGGKLVDIEADPSDARIASEKQTQDKKHPVDFLHPSSLPVPSLSPVGGTSNNGGLLTTENEEDDEDEEGDEDGDIVDGEVLGSPRESRGVKSDGTGEDGGRFSTAIRTVNARRLSTIVGMKRWAMRSRKKLTLTPQEKLLKDVEKRAAINMPRALGLQLIAETMPIVQGMVNTYRMQLGEKHPYTVACQRHLDEMKSRGFGCGADYVKMAGAGTGAGGANAGHVGGGGAGAAGGLAGMKGSFMVLNESRSRSFLSLTPNGASTNKLHKNKDHNDYPTTAIPIADDVDVGMSVGATSPPNHQESVGMMNRIFQRVFGSSWNQIDSTSGSGPPVMTQVVDVGARPAGQPEQLRSDASMMERGEASEPTGINCGANNGNPTTLVASQYPTPAIVPANFSGHEWKNSDVDKSITHHKSSNVINAIVAAASNGRPHQGRKSGEDDDEEE
ncbi:hypothetical protein HK102_005660 [Quaeritorhiza haematococci]|nr:hypothetical protein HK102_005660 [Quaeritorhiza haematococci]